MTEEQIVKGNELLYNLNKLKTQKERWEKAKFFTTIEVAADDDYGNRYYSDIEPSLFDFKVIKKLAIAKLSKEIKEIQREIDKL